MVVEEGAVEVGGEGVPEEGGVAGVEEGVDLDGEALKGTRMHLIHTSRYFLRFLLFVVKAETKLETFRASSMQDEVS